MKLTVIALLIAGAGSAGCMPGIQVAQNPVQKGPFTVRVGAGMDTRCMIASSTERPLFVKSFVIKGWGTPSEACADLDGDGFCESTKEIEHEFFLTAGRERYFDCNFMPDAKGWDFEVFYEEADVGAETIPFSRDASSTRPPPASISPRSTSRPGNDQAPPPPTAPPPAPAPSVTPPAPGPP